MEYLVMALLVVKAPAPVDSASPAFSPKTEQKPVRITADRLEVLGKRNEAIWIHNVKAHRDDVDIACDRMIAHYTDTNQLTRLECIGNAKAVEGDRWAKGERADFDNLTGILVVTGNPEAQQGNNHMTGSRVTFFVGTDKLNVENVTGLYQPDKDGPSLSAAPVAHPGLPAGGKKHP